MRRAITIRNQERGIALIFTLGILALLMIMMMAFASSMLQKRRISEATSSRLQTNLLVDSAINNATLQMMLTMNDTVTSSSNKTTGYNFNNVVSGSNDYSTSDLDDYTEGLAEDGDLPGALDTVLPSSDDDGDDYVLYKFNDSSSAVFDYPTWVYVQDEFSSASSKPYVGRYAYAVVPSYPSLDYTLAIEEPEDANRIGTSLADIDLTYIDVEFTKIDKTGYSAIYNYQQLLALKKGDDFEPDEVRINPYISFNTPSNLEVFRASNTYGNSELYYRYDLSKLNDIDDVDDLVGSLEQVEFTGDSVSKSSADTLAFFEKFTAVSNSEHTFADDEAWRNQIIANMIDYTKSSTSAVTSDITPSSWGGDDGKTDIPTYTGNKRTAYLNEVGMQVVLDFALEIENTIAVVKLDSVKMKPAVEIFDFYGESDEYEFVVWADFTASVRVDAAEAGAVDLELESEVIESEEVTVSSVANGYSFEDGEDYEHELTINSDTTSDGVSNDGSILYFSTTSSSSLSITVSDLKGTIYAAKLSKDGNVIDFARFGTDGEEKEFTSSDSIYQALSLDGNQTISYAYTFALATNDPRQNLNPDDWDYSENDSNGVLSSSTGWNGSNHSFDSINTLIADGTEGIDYDSEDYNDLANISTAFIREGDMESLWELGFIHRGVAWQTLNLKNTAIEDLANPTTNDYVDGDAEILDMVYLNSTKKINLNDNFVYEDNGKDYVDTYGYDSNNLLWQALFLGSSDKALMVNGSILADEYLDSGDNLTVTTSSDDYSSTIYYITSLLIPANFNSLVSDDGQIYRRSAIANALYYRSDIPDTDAGQEALIGKIANIVEAGQFPQVIRLIVVAQTLKPDAVTYSGDNPVVSDTAVANSVKKLVTMQREAATNKFVVIGIVDID